MTFESAPKNELEELIADGQALVRSLALQVARNVPMRVDLDDLIAYGQVGLAEAAREFDATRNVQFTTFAYYRIRGAIYDGVSKMSWTSRARYRRHRYDELANDTLKNELQNHPETDSNSLADEGRWLRNVTEKLAVVYLASGPDEARGGIRESSIEDRGVSPAIAAAGRELSEKLKELVNTLPPADANLIRAVYFEGLSLQDAGMRLGISKSWASRMHAKILEQLARSLRRFGVAD